MNIEWWSDPEKAQFFTHISRVFKETKTLIKIAIISYDPRYDLESLFSEYWPYGFENVKFDKKIVDNKTIFDFKFYDVDNKKILNNCLLISFKNRPFGFLLSNTHYFEFKYKQLKFFNKYYPLISRVFFRSLDLLQILNRLEKEEKLNIFTERYVVKKIYGKKESRICFKDELYSNIFLEALDQRLWVDSIVVKLQDDRRGLIGKIRIGRDGIFSYKLMDFAKFFNLVLEKVLADWYEKIYRNTLENRQRSLEALEPKPIRIVLKKDIFVEDSDAKRFIKNIHALSNWGYSIISLNKFLVYLTLFDYVSGGSFDIVIPSSREIYIIPQTQVTANVFNKLLSFLIENYEGEIENV
jgi:hypothetical protein